MDTDPSNKYHVVCILNNDDQTHIKSSQLSDCPGKSNILHNLQCINKCYKIEDSKLTAVFI